jgi:hypothetical protein
MSVADLSGLDPEELDAVESALEREPALRDELEMILDAVDPEARIAFWRAFVDQGGTGDRPASAVLHALVSAASGRTGRT